MQLRFREINGKITDVCAVARSWLQILVFAVHTDQASH